MREPGAPVRITILVDNSADAGLTVEHGFSAWVEAGGRTLLFDAGQGPALRHNAPLLGVTLGNADAVILSHGHYDHTGGVPLALEGAVTTEVYCHPAAVSARYSLRDGQARSIGMPAATRSVLKSLRGGRLHWVRRPHEIGPLVGISGPIPRVTDFEDTGGPFFLDPEGTRADPIADDVALWVRTDPGLVVVVGCCHAGLINTLTHVQRLSGMARIHAVIGGLHLLEADAARRERTIGALAELAPDLVVPCHCTGEQATAEMVARLPERVRTGRAGACYTFLAG